METISQMGIPETVCWMPEKKRLEAVRLFGVFHDFSCVAEQVTDILDPVLEIARMQKASAGDQGMHVGNHWTG